jgi:two-component system sensor histidine kinase YesM
VIGNRTKLTWQKAQRMLFLRDHSLSLKLLVFSALLVIIPLSLVGIISYQKSYTVLREEANQSSSQIIEQVKSHVEYYIRGFEIDSIRMLNHPEMRKLLLMHTPEEAEQSGIRQPILQLFKDTAYSRSDISRILLILDNMIILDTAESRSVVPASELSKEYWYQNVPMNGDIRLISRKQQWTDRSEPVISIVKRVINPLSLEPSGMLIMDVNFKRIQEIAEKVVIGNTGFLSIVDGEGHYIYHPNMLELGQAANLPNMNWMLSQDHGFFQTKKEPFYTFSRSTYLKWHILIAIPDNELSHGVDYIRRTILWTVIVTLLTAYLLAIGFASSIVRPVKKLQFFMKRVKEGDFTARAAIESMDEVGHLTNDFNRMVEKLQILMDEIYLSKLRESDLSLRQKETELKVLQSQINPHFLYNSLETVRGMALEQNMDNIATLVASLARLLRYNLNNASPIVTLQDEIAICEMYLKIQKFRFEEKFNYRFEVPDWAWQERIAKFSLQPIVENCVIHGIEPGLEHVTIHIRVYRVSGDCYAVCVQDNGIGLTPGRLAAIQKDLREKDVLSGGSHIGIVNVHRRIHYLFGDQFGLQMESNRGAGTSVSVMLPLQNKSDSNAVERWEKSV